jgi:hypothetical protein
MLKTAERLNRLFNSNFGAAFGRVLSSLSVISVVILVVISGR